MPLLTNLVASTLTEPRRPITTASHCSRLVPDSCRRRVVAMLLLGVFVSFTLLVALAYARPSDTFWTSGMHDGVGHGDDVVSLVEGAAALTDTDDPSLTSLGGNVRRTPLVPEVVASLRGVLRDGRLPGVSRVTSPSRGPPPAHRDALLYISLCQCLARPASAAQCVAATDTYSYPRSALTQSLWERSRR
jgi:hypothetical protein